MTTVSVPPTLDSIEAYFGGVSARNDLFLSLYKKCSLARETNLKNKNTALNCVHHHDTDFRAFLSIQEKLLAGNPQTSVSEERISALVSSWDAHCQEQARLQDARDPSVCAAAGFVSIPFHLNKEIVHKLDDDIKLQKSTHKEDSKSANEGPGGESSSTLPTSTHEKNKNRNKKLMVITVDTNYKPEKISKSITLRSACHYDIPLHVLGVDLGLSIFSKGIGGLAEKINLLAKYLFEFVAKVDDLENTILLFVDGTDVLFQSTEDEIIQKFVSTQSRILFTAEHACFPFKYFPWGLNLGEFQPCKGDCSNSRYICENLYPSFPSDHPDRRNRWMNSGAFMGYASDLLRLFRDMKTIPNDFVGLWCGGDQGTYNHMMLSRYWNIDLDYQQNLFFSFGFSNDIQEADPHTKDKTWKTALVSSGDENRQNTMQQIFSRDKSYKHNILYKSSYTQQVPALVHFNAEGKKKMREVNKYSYHSGIRSCDIHTAYNSDNSIHLFSNSLRQGREVRTAAIQTEQMPLHFVIPLLFVALFLLYAFLQSRKS